MSQRVLDAKVEFYNPGDEPDGDFLSDDPSEALFDLAMEPDFD